MSYTKAAGKMRGGSRREYQPRTVGTQNNQDKQAQERADLIARFRAKMEEARDDHDPS